MPSRIPNFGVKLADLKTALMTREWYRFFTDLYNLTGAGNNTLSIQDLALGGTAPPALPVTPFDQMTLVGNVSASLNFPNTAAGACSNLNITVPGAVITDIPLITVPAVSIPANGCFSVTMNNGSVTIRYTNTDPAIAYDPGIGTFRVLVFRV